MNNNKDNEEDLIHIYLSGHQLQNGNIVLEMRKKFILCEQNKPIIKNLILASLSDKPVKASVLLEFRDKLIASSFWKKNFPKWFEK
jgi:hypothetical protein